MSDKQRDIDLIKIHNRARACLDHSGAVTMEKLWKGIGSGFTTDYAARLVYTLVEAGELEKISPAGTWQQHEVFIAPRRH